MVDILDAIPELIQILAPDFTILYCNKAAYDFFKFKDQDIKGNKCYELFGWEERCSDCPVLEAVQSGKPIAVEKYLPKLDLYFHYYNVPIKDKNGEIECIVRRIQDITRYKKTEANLLSESQLDSLVLLAGLHDIGKIAIDEGILRKVNYLLMNGKL
ncbi:MAG: PAS domain-containing protein [Desulfotomaculum sp.]|nr:PAS domain-containing protein [Desulfotomaculum sp.]